MKKKVDTYHYVVIGVISILFIFLLYWIRRNTMRQNFEDKQKPLLFIHIPKTGGTYVEDEFKKANYNVGRHDINEKLKNEFKCPFWHTPSKKNKKINFKEYITFTVVRNPYERILSEYNWSKFPRYKTFDVSRSTELNDFVSNLNTSQIIEDGECHLVPQAEYLTDSYGNKVKHIIHQEKLTEELNKFIEKYKLNITLSNKKTNEKNRNHTVDELTETSKKYIQTYFKKDFEELGYEM